MKQRLMLSFLLAIALVFFALTKLTVSIHTMEGLFALAWLGFAFLVIGGNLFALLNYQGKTKERILPKVTPQQVRARHRQ